MSSTSQPIRVVIMDDEEAACRGYRSMLEEETDIAVVGTAYEPTGVLNLVRDHAPDVALLDVCISEDCQAGIVMVKKIRETFPSVKCMLMSNPKGLDINTYTEGIDAGAVCLLPKFVLRGDKLAQYVRDAYNGVEIPPPPGVAQRMARLWHAARPLAPVGGAEVELTKRELDILRLLAEHRRSELLVGEIIRQIGSQLCLSANTVRFHKQQMAEKLGVPSDIKSLVQEGLRRRLIGG